MTIDHIGLIFFPDMVLFRIIGRMAFPIFAYMVSEGCQYTRSRRRYLGTVILFGVICQTVYTVFSGDFYLNILMTLACSIVLIYAADYYRDSIGNQSNTRIFVPAVTVGILYYVSEILPSQFAVRGIADGFAVDYGFFGILLPLCFYLGRNKREKLMLGGIDLILLSFVSSMSCQWWSLLSLLFLAFYNGERGRLHMKYLFYFYYPLHLAVLYGLYTIISR